MSQASEYLNSTIERDDMRSSNETAENGDGGANIPDMSQLDDDVAMMLGKGPAVRTSLQAMNAHI